MLNEYVKKTKFEEKTIITPSKKGQCIKILVLETRHAIHKYGE